jgi:hypothetical protein
VEDCEDRIVDRDLPVNELSALNKDKLRALHDMAEETTGLLTRSQVNLGSDQGGFRVVVNGVELDQAYPGRGDGVPAVDSVPVHAVPAPESEPEPIAVADMWMRSARTRRRPVLGMRSVRMSPARGVLMCVSWIAETP